MDGDNIGEMSAQSANEVSVQLDLDKTMEEETVDVVVDVDVVEVVVLVEVVDVEVVVPVIPSGFSSSFVSVITGLFPIVSMATRDW